MGCSSTNFDIYFSVYLLFISYYGYFKEGFYESGRRIDYRGGAFFSLETVTNRKLESDFYM